MQPTKEDLAAQYDKLSNSELLKRVQSGTLVPLAHEVACEELRSRGVEFEKPNEHGESQDQDTDAEVDAHSDIGFVTIANIVNPLRASLLRGQLQSEGIFVHLLGEHLGVAHIVFSAATGGIRVQVRADQVDRAREILAEFNSIQESVRDGSGYEPQSPNESSDDKDQQPTASDSPFAPPKSYVADVQQAKERREAINRPSTARFFWMFAIIAIAAVFYLMANA